ncbi:hypothetical protein HMPREF1092_00375 [Clostridium thermobutyricum]|uniref:PepSY domain-containing protein n=1 Tax=Clostridium thermobutyricum TaxID=29372 RepID=N9Y4W3_9CLOT|nr:PepSY domain-containing protein [Clostridium thermobutyricum]ENZ03189.1 hypothetical protein HMPREF1092_00375 [Clostridium thermobutyricum]
MNEEKNNLNENVKEADYIELGEDKKEETSTKEKIKKIAKEKIKITKKKIAVLCTLAVVGCGIVGTVAIADELMEMKGINPVDNLKSKIELKFAKTPNYTLDQAKEIALKAVNGTVIKTSEEVDDGIVEYKISIKDNNNFLKKVTVNGDNGAIIKIKDNVKNQNDFHNLKNDKHDD